MLKKIEIDRSTLYSFNGPFKLLHADVANLKFLGKSANVPKYAPLVVDLYSSKVYVFSKTDFKKASTVLCKYTKQKKKQKQTAASRQ